MLRLQAGTQNPGITGTVANTAASVLNTVGLGRIVPGQVHPQQQGFANEGGAATAGQSQHGGFDGQQQGGQQFQEQQEQPYVHEEHATSPQVCQQESVSQALPMQSMQEPARLKLRLADMFCMPLAAIALYTSQ